ncbi:MAG: hypothetical protein WA678_05420 [Rhabdochlamydiaceae bacterium]|jgi:hypothetical protein
MYDHRERLWTAQTQTYLIGYITDKVGSLLASFLEGRTRVFQWNPRYPFLKEIQNLAEKAYAFLPLNIQESRFQKKKRKRPGRSGKPL